MSSMNSTLQTAAETCKSRRQGKVSHCFLVYGVSYKKLPELEWQVMSPVGDVQIAYYENQLYERCFSS